MASIKQKIRRYPFKRQLSRKMRRIIFMFIAAVIASGINYYNEHHKFEDVTLSHSDSYEFSKAQQKKAINTIRKAKDNTNAKFWIGFNGNVIQKLEDDNKGIRHQKFLVSPTLGITLLVAHNIDLAKRAPIKVGDSISLYGRYEWNNRGGVMHWTHHDPKGKKPGGWIKVNGKTYR